MRHNWPKGEKQSPLLSSEGSLLAARNSSLTGQRPATPCASRTENCRVPDKTPVGSTVVVELPERPGEVVQGISVRRSLRIEVTEVARHVPSMLTLSVVEDDPAEADAPAPDAAQGEETSR